MNSSAKAVADDVWAIVADFLEINTSSTPISSTYSFYHDQGEGEHFSIRQSMRETLSCATCIRDCRSTVTYLADIYNDRLLSHWKRLLAILSNHSRIDETSIAEFGWQTLLPHLHVHDGEYEAGGGAGMGLQVICDGRTLLSLGGGLGGGWESHPSFSKNFSHSFGSGGGGGIQLNDSSVSIGGGGGCGTSSSGEVLCGYSFDDDRLDETYERSSSLLSECGDVITVIGGGGGGGGTGECCLPFSLGYGFSFKLELRRDRPARDLTEGSSPGRDEQYRYDSAGCLFHEAMKSCNGSYEDWCCVCERAKNMSRSPSPGLCPRGDALELSWVSSMTCCGPDSQSDQRPSTRNHPFHSLNESAEEKGGDAGGGMCLRWREGAWALMEEDPGLWERYEDCSLRGQSCQVLDLLFSTSSSSSMMTESFSRDGESLFLWQSTAVCFLLLLVCMWTSFKFTRNVRRIV